MTSEVTKRYRAMLDQAVTDSHSLAELVGHFETVAPELAGALEGKPLLASRSPWGVLAFYVVGVLLGSSMHLSALWAQFLAGLFVLVGGYVMRLGTSQPITGILRPRPV